MKLAGARCLVIGGVHRLGREISLELASHGAAVAISSRRQDEELQAAVAALGAAGAPAVAGLSGDVREPHGARALVSDAATALGGLDALVFAASGPFVPRAPQDIGEAAWDQSLDIIAKGFFFTACAAHDHFAAGRPDASVAGRAAAEADDGPADAGDDDAGLEPDAGVIVALTDCMGLQPWSSFAAHGAAKAAQIHLVKQLARAWAAEGVRVCGVAPGPVDLHDDLHRDATLRAATRGEWQRLVRPEAVGAAVRFCLETQGVTGVNVIVDNGMLLTS